MITLLCLFLVADTYELEEIRLPIELQAMSLSERERACEYEFKKTPVSADWDRS